MRSCLILTMNAIAATYTSAICFGELSRRFASMVLSISINSDRFGCTGDMVEFRRPQTALLRRFSRRNHVEIQKALHTPKLCTHNTNKKINEKQRKQGHTSTDCVIARQNNCTKIESYETVTWWVKILVPDEGEGCSSCFWKRDQGRT